MKDKRYAHEEVSGLLPLLASIGNEIEERTRTLALLEIRIEALQEDPAARNAHHALVAEAATHRRQLRLARNELERLGCSVIGTSPLTFCIPGEVDGAARRLLWQSGDPVLH